MNHHTFSTVYIGVFSFDNLKVFKILGRVGNTFFVYDICITITKIFVSILDF